MTPEEARITELEAENTVLRGQVSELPALRAQVEALVTQVANLKARLAKDSHNSSKPPASDGLGRVARKTKSLRKPSGKKPGGQLGHRGETLRLVGVPDAVVEHRPARCAHCQTPLADALVVLRERRPVHELQRAPVLHSDEPGGRRAGKGAWAHVTSTARLTHYAIHPTRGRAATDAIGILPTYTGVSVHDGLGLYRAYTQCRHALCNIHHLRELTFLEE